MPRVRQEDGPLYHIICDQCGFQGPDSLMEDITRFGFEQPPGTVGIYLCDRCARLDIGQEDWLLRFMFTEGDFDRRVNMRGLIAALREDPHVADVQTIRHAAELAFYVVRFIQGARRPHDPELVQQTFMHRTYQYLQREPSALVQGLIDAQVQEGWPVEDLAPGSMGRAIIESVARTIETRELDTTIITLERTRQSIYDGLVARIGELPSGTALRFIQQITESTYEAHRPRTEQETREAIVRAAVENRSSRWAFSVSTPWVPPLRRNIDYQSTARRTFMVDPLPEGALPIYGDPGEPSLLPEWCHVGRWVKRRYDNMVARVENVKAEEVILRANSLPPPWDGVITWDRLLLVKDNDSGQTSLACFEDTWEPTANPNPPPTSWERIMKGVL